MSLSYNFTCPECDTTYVGDLEDGEACKTEKVSCEECNYEMDIQVEIDIIVSVDQSANRYIREGKK